MQGRDIDGKKFPKTYWRRTIQSPQFDEMALKYEGKVIFARIEIDKVYNPYIFYKNRSVVDHCGGPDPIALAKEIENIIHEQLKPEEPDSDPADHEYLDMNWWLKLPHAKAYRDHEAYRREPIENDPELKDPKFDKLKAQYKSSIIDHGVREEDLELKNKKWQQGEDYTVNEKDYEDLRVHEQLTQQEVDEIN